MNEQSPPGPHMPEWLEHVPISKDERPFIEIGRGMVVPRDMLEKALTVKVGTIVGSFSIDPGLAQIAAEFTENAGWKQLPAEPTTIERTAEDSWTIRVGDREENVTADVLTGLLEGTLRLDVEES